MLRRSLNIVFISLVFFILGYLTSTFIQKKDLPIITLRRSLQKNYKYTNPLLDCEIDTKMSLVPVNTLQKNIYNRIQNLENVNEVSIYFRDLNNGASFGINENTTFSPASLLKLPIMIAYLKLAETKPDILNNEITYTGIQQSFNNIDQINNLIIGNNYKVSDLIYRMMSLSDNAAFELLFKNIDSKIIKSIYKELDIIYPDDSTIDDYITAKSYAGLFRILYNSTYLNREKSEMALEILTKSDYNSGIKSGIPKGVNTALKFGVREINNQGLVQLHDCGIIYMPNKPFILCIMTRGKNYKDLSSAIKSITEEIYKNLHQNEN